jgi:DNA-directed RNA polymerase specialized sigma24 family protein
VESVESFLTQVFKFPPSPKPGVEATEQAFSPEGVTPPDLGLFLSTDWTGLGEGGDSVARGPYRNQLNQLDRESLHIPGEDSLLIKRLSAGDEEALGTLMDRYGGALLHFAHRLVGDMQLAEEIYQDTMLKAWQQASSFRVDGHLKAWLFRVARNNAIDYMRKKRVTVEEYTAWKPLPPPSARTAKPSAPGFPQRSLKRSTNCLPPTAKWLIYGSSISSATRRSPKYSVFRWARSRAA